MTTRKVNSRVFKQEVVRLALESGNTTETARNLGLHLSVLRRWKKEAAKARKKVS